MTTNDIVINKLTQILSYLRHGKRDAKKNKKKSAKPDDNEAQIKPDVSRNMGLHFVVVVGVVENFFNF